MYKVLKAFTDLQDGHVYLAGDEYPRKGANPDAKRVEELASEANKRGEALIVSVEPPKKAEILPESEEKGEADVVVDKAEKKPKTAKKTSNKRSIKKEEK